MARSQQASLTAKEARSKKFLSVLMAFVMATTLMVPHAAWGDQADQKTADQQQNQNIESPDQTTVSDMQTQGGETQATEGETPKAAEAKSEASASHDSMAQMLSEPTGDEQNATTVAKIGDQEYATLEEAIAAVPEGEPQNTPNDPTIITLLRDTNAGFDIGDEHTLTTKNVEIDLAKHTLTLGPAIGSTGTETNGLRVLAYSECSVRNGTVVCSNIKNDKDTYVKIGMANYGTLSLHDVKLESSEHVLYTINNRGMLNLSGTTSVESGGAEQCVAITNDPYNAYYSDFDASMYVAGDKVTVGKILLERYGNNTNTGAKIRLDIAGGTYGEIVEDGADVVRVVGNITGGTFASDPSEYCTDHCKVVDNGNGTWAVVENVVATIGEKTYPTLQDAIGSSDVEADPSATIVLQEDVTDQANILINYGMNVTLDLNGHNVGFAANTKGSKNYFEVNDGTLNLTGKGKVYEQGYYYAPVLVFGSTQDEAGYSTVNVGKDVVLEGYDGLTVNNSSNCAYGVEVNVAGTLSGKADSDGFGGIGLYVDGNITKTGTNVPKIIIESTAKLTGEMGANSDPQTAVSDGMYLAGNADVTIKEGASIEAGTGIEIRAGKLAVEGGTIVGTTTPTDVKPNGNGSTSAGAGIAVAQHGTKLPVTVEISGGDISGYSALYESNPQNNDPDSIAKVKLSVHGGTFSAINGGTVAVYSQDCTGFVTGGKFTNDVSEYCAEGFSATPNADSTSWTVEMDVAATIEGNPYPTLKDAIGSAQNGATIDLQKNLAISESMIIDKSLIINLNGKTITNNVENARLFDIAAPDVEFALDGTVDGSAVTIPDTNAHAMGTVYVEEVATGSTITFNGGTYEGETADNGNLLFATPVDKPMEVTLTLLNVVATGNDALIYSDIKDGNGAVNAVITGGAYTATDGYVFALCGASDKSTLTFENVKATATNCYLIQVYGSVATFTNCDFAVSGKTNDGHPTTPIAVSGGGTANIVSGTYTSEWYGPYVYNSGGTINIEDGTFATTGEAVLKADKSVTADPSVINVSGGDFTGGYGIAEGTTLAITGGTFSMDPSAYVADDYSATQGEDSKWTVAENVVAKIGETTYPTLKAAFAAAAENDTVTLAKDVELDETAQVKAEQNFVFDLNGKKITVTQNNGRSLYAIDNYGTLTLKDSSEGEVGSITARGVENFGTMYLQSGTIDSCDSNGGGASIWNEGSFEMTGGTLRVSGDDYNNGSAYPIANEKESSTALITGGALESPRISVMCDAGEVTVSDITLSGSTDYWNVVKVPGGKVTLNNVAINAEKGGCVEAAGGTVEINDCKFTQGVVGSPAYDSMNIAVSSGGKAIVNGGTYTSDGYSLYVFSSGGTIIVEDGTFSGVKGVLQADLDGENYPDGTVNVVLKGGDYTGAIAEGGSGSAEKRSIDITGGTFSSDVSVYCNKDYQCVQDGAVYKVSAKPKIAEVGGVQYTNLDDAIAAAADGSTVTMIDNVSIDASKIKMDAEEDSPYYANLEGKSITLDLAGKAITFDLSKCDIQKRATTQSKITDERGLIYVSAGAGLTVKDSGANGTIKATSPAGSTYSALSLIQNYGLFTMESGTIKGAERVYYLVTMYGSASQTNIEGGMLDNQWGEPTDGGICLSGNGTSTYAGYQLAITGGTLKGGEQTLYLPSAGKTTISGDPVLEGTGRAIEIRAGELTIDGGTFTATAARLQDATAVSGGTGAYTGAIVAVKHKNTSEKAYAGPAKVTINGGTFVNANGDAIAAKNEIVDEATAANNAITLAVSGGSFSGGINNGNLVGPAAEGANKLDISGGYFTADPSAYVTAGMTALPSDTSGYVYMVGESKAATDAKPVVVEPEVTVEPDADLGEAKDEIVKNVKQTQVEGLSAHANAVVEDLTTDEVEAAEKALEEAIHPDVSAPITVFVQAYLDIKPKAYTEESGAKALTLDITPMARVVASTAENVEDIVLDEAGKNAVIVDEPKELEVKTETVITVPLPAGFVASVDDAVYAKHVKADGKTYTYQAVLSGDVDSGFVATFTNPHGFSEFTVTTSDDSVAQIDGIGYPTLQAAIDVVTDGQTIKLLKNAEGASVSKAVSFTLDLNSFSAGAIVAGEGYLLNVEGGVYTVKAAIPISSVTLDQTSLSLKVGATGKLVATVAPADTTDDKTVVWTTSDSAVATVAQDGTVAAVKAGKATVTATAGGKAAACEVTVAAAKDLSRLGGDNRYGTMALASKAAFPEAGSCSTVIVARGDNFPDALAAAGLAGVTGGQVLLTETGELTAETKAEIKRLGARKAYVIGDENSIANRTLNEIKSITGDATRIGGESRLDTAVKIYEAGKGGWGPTAIVATGKKAADSLSASPVAYGLKAPIFLADDSGNLPATALDALAKGGFKHVIVLGDKYSVSDATYKKIETTVGSAERIGGANRYITSQLTAERALKNGFTCEAVSLTAGRDGKYADALVASSLGGRSMSVLLLVDDGADASVCVGKVLAPNNDQVSTAYVLGDKYTVSDTLYKAIQKALA